MLVFPKSLLCGPATRLRGEKFEMFFWQSGMEDISVNDDFYFLKIRVKNAYAHQEGEDIKNKTNLLSVFVH